MEKLTLKEAKEIANKITNNVPTVETLRNWVNKGLLSGTVDYINKGKAGGRIGLYPGSLPIEIATSIYLKNRGFKISDIAQARKMLVARLKEGDEVLNVLRKRLAEMNGYSFVVEGRERKYLKQNKMLLLKISYAYKYNEIDRK